MSELDSLSASSLSGVPMRPKAKSKPEALPPDASIPELTRAVRDMANALADNQRRLVDALTAVLPSKPKATPQSVGVSFERGPGNLITKGYATNGERGWNLTFTRRDGRVFVTALAE